MAQRMIVLPVLAGMGALLWADLAGAQAAGCSLLSTDADASLRARWPGLLPAVHAAFDQRDDIDRCARVALSARNDSIGLEVALPDGRLALRAVSRPEDVVPTLEALLLLPRRDGQSPSRPSASTHEPIAATAPASSAPAATRPGTTGVTGYPDRRPSNADASPSSGAGTTDLGVELSAETGARVGDGQTGLGIGALSLLELSGWLLGFEGRIDRYQRLRATRPVSAEPAAAADGMSGALELGVLTGRRLRFGALAFDFLLGPAVAMQGTTTVETKTAAGQKTESSSSTVPRLHVLSRMVWGTHSTLRGFLGVDGEIGPARADSLGGASRLPRWSVGLVLGAAVGTR